MNSQFKEPYRLSNTTFTNLIAVFFKKRLLPLTWTCVHLICSKQILGKSRLPNPTACASKYLFNI